MYHAIADYHFARALLTVGPGGDPEALRPRYPLATHPGRQQRLIPVLDQRRDRLGWTLRRVTRHWLRTRGCPQAAALASRRISVYWDDSGRVGVHLHAYSGSQRRRAKSQAAGLAARLARVLRAAAAGPETGVWTVVVSWGYDPASLAAQDRVLAVA